MAVAAFSRWESLGRPLEPAQPVREMVQALKAAFPLAAGTFSWYADASHYEAGVPEDHTPYSYTGWPLPNPEWFVFATDVMHQPDLGVDCNVLFDYWIGEARTGRIPSLKYLIWQGQRYDVRAATPWEPTPTLGHFDHIHLSFRTDYTHTGFGDWNPIPGGDNDMLTPQEKAWLHNIAAIVGAMIDGADNANIVSAWEDPAHGGHVGDPGNPSDVFQVPLDKFWQRRATSSAGSVSADEVVDEIASRLAA